MPDLSKFFDRLESRLYVRGRASDFKLTSEGGRKKHATSIWRNTLIAIFGATLFASFIWIFFYVASTTQRLAENPKIEILNSPSVSARIIFQNLAQCDSSESTCWTSAKFDDEYWDKTTIPDMIISDLPDYKRGREMGWMGYRFWIPVADKFKNSNEVIAFSPGFINHSFFEVYVNGRKLYQANGISTQNSLVVIPLDKQLDLSRDKILIAIRASLKEGDYGLAHHTNMLMGPKTELDELYVAGERVNYTYFLLFLFGKGSVFIVFTLFYFYTRAHKGFFDFLVFAFFVTLENIILLAEDYLSPDSAVLLYFLSKTFASYALLRFFINFYHVRRVDLYTHTIGILLIIATSLMCFDSGWGTHTINVPILLAYSNTVLSIILVLSVVIGLLTLRMVKKYGVGSDYLRNLKGFVLFISIFALLFIWEAYFTEYTGTEKRAILDLIFFYFIALISARNFGFNEGKINTLEAHMEEKKRMEAELQEASEIAKAFNPSSTPNWPFCQIAVFHRAISESSGDWYAFERAPNGKLFHCIMCDITGHGVQAALVVSTCKTVLSFLSRSRPDVLNKPDFLIHYMKELNYTLYHHGEGNHVSTLLGLTFDPENQSVHYIVAGHPPPILLRNDDSKPKALVSRHSVLGIREVLKVHMATAPFEPGDQIVAYTDGLPLSVNLRSLRQIASITLPVNDAPGQLYKNVWDTYRKKTKKEPDDDVSIIWFKGAA